jgi:uncharacterized membrane protein
VVFVTPLFMFSVSLALLFVGFVIVLAAYRLSYVTQSDQVSSRDRGVNRGGLLRISDR